MLRYGYTCIYITLWRASNIKSIPIPNLKSIGFENGNSFLRWLSDEKNVFTEEMGISICEDIKRRIDSLGVKTKKSNRFLVLEVGRLTARTAGLLFAICESHRQIAEKSGKKNKKIDSLLTSGCVQKTEYYYELFGDKFKAIMGEEGFSNRRANKSYNNYIHNYSEENGDMFATHILSILRGYVVDYEGISNTTTIYETRTADGTIASIISTLFERGSFAFAKFKLLSIADKSFDERDSDIQTGLIKSLDMTPADVETTVRTIYEQREVITNLITRMALQPTEIKEIMGQLAFGNTYTKHNHSRCLLKAILNSNIDYTKKKISILNLKDYKNKTNCLIPDGDSCFGCPMLVGEMYLLYELNDLIFDAIKNLKLCNSKYECYMYTNLIRKTYNPILREAQIVIGKEKVNLFVDVKRISQELKILDKDKKIVEELNEV